MDWQTFKQALSRPLVSDWDEDVIGRILFGPPTLGHVLLGVLIASLIAIAVLAK